MVLMLNLGEQPFSLLLPSGKLILTIDPVALGPRLPAETVHSWYCCCSRHAINLEHPLKRSTFPTV
jgi:hypothetical protein